MSRSSFVRIIGINLRESHIKKLSDLLIHLLEEFDEILIPLPNSLCRDLIERSLGNENYDPLLALRYLNTSLERLWRPVIERIFHLPKTPLFWGKAVYCYHRDDYIKSLEETGLEISRLLILANVYNKIDLDSWVSVYKKSINKRFITELMNQVSRERVAIIVSGYIEYELAQISIGSAYVEKCVINELIPTPQDVMMLYLLRDIYDKDTLLKIVNWIIRYFNKIILSETFDDVYNYLSGDEYRSFLNEIGVKPIDHLCKDQISTNYSY
ncbi:MAG: hypothetical protein ACP5I7_06760 [Sulfolobales archaeon]